MTDRHAGYIVALDQDIREDDAEAIIAAISMIKGVLSVSPIVPDGMEYIASARTKAEILNKIFAAIKDS